MSSTTTTPDDECPRHTPRATRFLEHTINSISALAPLGVERGESSTIVREHGDACVVVEVLARRDAHDARKGLLVLLAVASNLPKGTCLTLALRDQQSEIRALLRALGASFAYLEVAFDSPSTDTARFVQAICNLRPDATQSFVSTRVRAQRQRQRQQQRRTHRGKSKSTGRSDDRDQAVSWQRSTHSHVSELDVVRWIDRSLAGSNRSSRAHTSLTVRSYTTISRANTMKMMPRLHG